MQDYRMNTFLAVCRYMNYTKAAEALNITQPAVSQHIRFLEREYGVPLFKQNGKKLSLTEAGEILKNGALLAEHNEIHMKSKIEKIKIGTQKYTFGATLTVSEFLLTDKLARFIDSHRGSNISMHVANTRLLLSMLDNNQLDFAIVEGKFPKTDYEYKTFSREEYVAVAAPDIAEKYKGKTVSDMVCERIILREKGSGTREIFEDWISEKGIQTEQFADTIELGNIGSINNMVKAGLGVTFCYRAAVRQLEKTGELCTIKLNDMPLVHDIMFIYQKGSIYRKDYMEMYEELCGR